MSLYFLLVALMAAPLLGTTMHMFFPGGSRQKLPYILQFSGGYLLALLLAHLLPELFEETHAHCAHGHAHAHEPATYIGYFLLLGFVLQIGLDFVSKGIAHGHTHAPISLSHAKILGVCLALSGHAFLDGLVIDLNQPLVLSQIGGVLIGICLHKLPIGFILDAFLAPVIKNGKKRFLIAVLFALASPLGLLFTYHLSTSLADNVISKYVQAVGIGSLFHIATTIVFESNPDHKWVGRPLVMFLLGTLLAVGTCWLIPHSH